MGRTTDILAILFADIAKSTHIYESLGDKDAKSLIDACITVLSEVTVKYQGTVIKTIGDEVMCTFPTADDAVEAAIEMHQTLDDTPFDENPNIYVGFQFGKVIREDGDVFGDAVNMASRMVAMAKQRQIITTEGTIKLLSKERQMAARCIDQTTVKGKSGGIRIFEVIWEEHDLTVMSTTSQEIATAKSRLELTYQGQTIELDENRPSATLGRQQHNDVVVNDSRVSRSHARIEYNRGKFTLIDQSSNGTMVQIQDKKAILLKREEAQLQGSGIIGLGCKVTPESEAALHFSIKS
jgi:class 3 adenylate cyclase